MLEFSKLYVGQSIGGLHRRRNYLGRCDSSSPKLLAISRRHRVACTVQDVRALLGHDQLMRFDQLDTSLVIKVASSEPGLHVTFCVFKILGVCICCLHHRCKNTT